MANARKCKSEKTTAKTAAIMVHVAKLPRVMNLVVTSRLVDRQTWKEIAGEHGMSPFMARKAFRVAIQSIESLLRWEGKLRKRRRKARDLKLRR